MPLSRGKDGIRNRPISVLLRSNRIQCRIQDFPQRDAQTPKSAIIFQFFPRKLHENERIWTPQGGRVPGAPP